jgi:hypothetical protein
MTEYPDFSVHTDVHSYCLEAEGREFWIHKEFLSQISPVFEKFCTNTNYKEAIDGRARLTGKKSADILEFLRVIIPESYEYPNRKKVDGKIVKFRYPSTRRAFQVLMLACSRLLQMNGTFLH